MIRGQDPTNADCRGAPSVVKSGHRDPAVDDDCLAGDKGPEPTRHAALSPAVSAKSGC